jgi:hypothetical protein
MLLAITTDNKYAVARSRFFAYEMFSARSAGFVYRRFSLLCLLMQVST